MEIRLLILFLLVLSTNESFAMDVKINGPNILIDGKPPKGIVPGFNMGGCQNLFLKLKGKITQNSYSLLLGGMEKGGIKSSQSFIEPFNEGGIPMLEVSPQNYAFFGLLYVPQKIKQFSLSKISVTPSGKLSNEERSYLRSKWAVDYLQSPFIKSKVKSLRDGFEESFEKVLDYRFQWVFRDIEGNLIGHIAIKTFDLPWTGRESAAIHIWVSKIISADEKSELHRYVHSILLPSFEFPLFAGTSVENIASLKRLLRYGFKPITLEIKREND